MNTSNESAKAAFVKTIPVFAGYIVLGIGFGRMMAAHGYSMFWIVIYPVFMYSGAMQYMAVDLGTRNKIFSDGRLLSQLVLEPGLHFFVGNVELMVEMKE